MGQNNRVSKWPARDELILNTTTLVDGVKDLLMTGSNRLTGSMMIPTNSDKIRIIRKHGTICRSVGGIPTILKLLHKLGGNVMHTRSHIVSRPQLPANACVTLNVSMS